MAKFLDRTMIGHMPTPTRITVALRIMSDDLDPDEITRLLGVEPTSIAGKGDVCRTRAGREILTKTSIWSVRADDAKPGDLDDCIVALLDRISSEPAVWRELSQRFRCDVFCGLFVHEGNAGVGLRPETLTMLGVRGLRLDLDIYACAD